MQRKWILLSFVGGLLVIASLAGFYLVRRPGAQPLQAGLRQFPSSLSPQLPYDVNAAQVEAMMAQVHPQNGGEYSPHDTELVLKAQREFDILSWQAFLALNWPQQSYESPESSLNATSGQPLWSYWVPIEKIFLPNGARPQFPWDPAQQVKDAATNGIPLTMTKAAWRQQASASDNFQAFSGPLVDQNGKWARYEALVDPEEYEYLYKNELYSIDGQIRFSNRYVNQSEVSMPLNSGDKKHGSIEIKLSWKELGPNDDRSRFYTKRVRVELSEPTNGGPPQYRTIDAGLVGMHIAMRTESSPEWIWSTFEQIDNVRQNPLEHGGLSHANFMNPALKNAPVNVLPAKNGDCTNGTNCQTWYENLTTTPVQTSRVQVPLQHGLNPIDDKITEAVAELNKQVQALLHSQGSVFQYYELIGTQWPVHKFAPAYAGGQGSAPESITNKTPGDVVPVFLVNTTMETYFQKGGQNAGCLEQDDRLPDNCTADSTPVTGTESCVGCHYSAGIATGWKRDMNGNPVIVNGVKQPIYGENGHFGRSAHASFSWMLQIETSKQNLGAEASTPARKRFSMHTPNRQP
ncbi:MAG: hypothetical protein HOQ35_10660 [Acidobacteriaceae bacterium]|nr:hypothetical protein [Acidobacteriaceae bacterium]